MNMKKSSLLLVVVVVTVLALVASPISVGATHSWSGYHWARTSNPFTLKLADNTHGQWKTDLPTVSSQWSQSTVMDTTIVAGDDLGREKKCPAVSGRVEVCSADYGGVQWLGVATIWLSNGHISQGTVKNNDHYFGNSTYQYNNIAEMEHVICQEVGHTFGLDHQSTDGSSLNTCMDYYHNTSASDTKSTTPNAGDYDELLCIYDPADAGKTLTHSPHTCTGTGHLDSFTTINAAPASAPGFLNGDFSSPNSWGKLVSGSATSGGATYVHDFGNGNLVVTFVIWAK